MSLKMTTCWCVMSGSLVEWKKRFWGGMVKAKVTLLCIMKAQTEGQSIVLPTTSALERGWRLVP